MIDHPTKIVLNVLRDKAKVYREHPSYPWLLKEDEPDKVGNLLAHEMESTASLVEWILEKQEGKKAHGLSSDTKVIVVEGNPVDGFTYTGPFKDMEDAGYYGDNAGGEWWICQLTSIPSDYCTGSMVDGQLQHDGDTCPIHELGKPENVIPDKHLMVAFTPQAIREHYESSECEEWVNAASDEKLREIGNDAIANTDLWDTFAAVLNNAMPSEAWA